MSLRKQRSPQSKQVFGSFLHLNRAGPSALPDTGGESSHRGWWQTAGDPDGAALLAQGRPSASSAEQLPPRPGAGGGGAPALQLPAEKGLRALRSQALHNQPPH